MTDRKPPAGTPVAPARPAPRRPAQRGQQPGQQRQHGTGPQNGTAPANGTRPAARPASDETPTDQIPAVGGGTSRSEARQSTPPPARRSPSPSRPASDPGTARTSPPVARPEQPAARRHDVETAGSITRDSDDTESADRTAAIPVIREPLRERGEKAAATAAPTEAPETETTDDEPAPARRGWFKGRGRRTDGDAEASDETATVAAPVARSGGDDDDEDATDDAQAPAATTKASSESGVRTARLRLVRVDPWSVMKVAFALSFALAIVTVVAVTIVWAVLDLAGVWDAINSSVATILSDNADAFDVTDYVGFGRIIGFTIIISAVDVILITAIATVGSFLYNLSASLLGGLDVTLAENS